MAHRTAYALLLLLTGVASIQAQPDAALRPPVAPPRAPSDVKSTRSTPHFWDVGTLSANLLADGAWWLIGTIESCQPQVVVEMRFVSMSGALAEAVRRQYCDVAELEPDQMRELLNAAQADPRTNVLIAPKITALHAQSISFEMLHQGAGAKQYRLNLLPEVAHDCSAVTLNLKTSMDELTAPGDQAGKVHREVQCTLNIHDGNTILLHAWETPASSATVPVLSKVPYVNRLFKEAPEQTMVLVTTRILREPAR